MKNKISSSIKSIREKISKKLFPLVKNSAGEEVKFNYFRPVGKIALIFFIGFSFYLFVSSVVLLFLTKPEKEVKIPYVVGKPFVEVYNSLMRKGLKPEISFYDVFDIDNGIVLNQHPDSGSIVTEGSKLKLVVSRSSLFIDIPNVVGIELPFAINKLKNLHIYNKSVSLGVGVISYIPSDKSAENIVVDQSPRAGEKVTPDRKINLLVSAGKTDAGMKMPSLEGQSIDLCLDLLLAKGLSVSFDVVDTGTRDQSGNVFAQDPPRDAAVKSGDNVRLKVHYYPLKNHPYHAYEKMEYTAPADEKGGLYEAYIEDDLPRRIAYSRSMKPGEKLSFVFHRAGNARVKILCDKKAVKVMKIDVEEFD